MKRKKLVNIITEATLKSNLLEEIIQLGSSGYTIFEVNGSGQRGIRDGDFTINQNIQIEVICDEEVANKIFEHCKKNYSKNYAMLIFASDVDVVDFNS